ncbi:hypothetical protein BDC45DRAFT_570750 [Circinella umbellata]|nr:hypothetical protein BDC45DRAFT_570750 [Circinella umbellata]
MDPIKTSAVNAVRRLIENIPLRTVKQDNPCETEVWAMFSDPIFRSLFNYSRPKCLSSLDEQEKAKTYEPTNNNHTLAKDLVRLGMFNKDLINTANVRSTIGFQINELSCIDIPQSIEHVDQLTTISQLQLLAKVAHVFEMIRKTSLRCTSEECEQKKTKSIKNEDLKQLVAKKRARNSLCSSRF